MKTKRLPVTSNNLTGRRLYFSKPSEILAIPTQQSLAQNHPIYSVEGE